MIVEEYITDFYEKYLKKSSLENLYWEKQQ